MVVKVMKECLVDLSDYRPQAASDVDPKVFDAVYECPEIAFGDAIEAYRELCDFIKNEAYLFFREL